MPRARTNPAIVDPAVPDAPRTLILFALEQRGVTQAELGRRMGITDPAVSQLLAEGRNMTIVTLTRALDCLGYRLTLEANPR